MDPAGRRRLPPSLPPAIKRHTTTAIAKRSGGRQVVATGSVHIPTRIPVIKCGVGGAFVGGGATPRDACTMVRRAGW